MSRKMQRGEGESPDNSERMEEYWDNDRQEVDLPWDAKGTGHHKSKSKGKERNNRRRPTPDPQRDEFIGDSDLE